MAIVFSAGFEGDDFSEWDTTPSGTKHQTSASAGMNGTSYGDLVTPSNSGSTPEEELLSYTSTAGTFHLGFFIDINTLTATSPGPFANCRLISISCDILPTIVDIQLEDNGSGFFLDVLIGDDSTGEADSYSSSVISAGEHSVEVAVYRATNDTSSDGSAEVYIDGTLEDTMTGLDNYDAFDNVSALTLTDNAVFGGSSGNFYIDQIVLRDDDTPIYPPAGSHLWLSSDAGATFTNIGSAAWGSNVVGGVVVKPGTNYNTIWAMVGTTLYKTTNQGASWSSVATLTFETDFLDLLDGDILYCANRASGGNRASIISPAGAVSHINTSKSTTGGNTSGQGVA